jgi:sulfate-transporting ATPase
MTEAFRFSLLGLGAGGLYALAAIGLVLVYRGSGVVNFAQAAMGMVGAYVYYEFRVEQGLAQPVAVVAGLVGSALLGAVFYLVIIRRMGNASQLARIVATLALLVVLLGAASLRYGPLPKLVPSMLPTGPVEILGASVGADRIWIFLLVVALTAVLWLVYRFTTFGVATTAVAENPRAAAALAISPDLVATANWAVGAGLGALAAIFLVPITGLGPANVTLLVIPVLAAAVIGGFRSFPITTAAGCAMGIGQSLATRYVEEPGWGAAVPFLAVTAFLIVKGRVVAGKDERFGRMPALGTGRVAPVLVAFGAVASVVCIWWLFPTDWLDAFALQLMIAIVLMSFVVVTGFAGQLSLAQYAFAGVGALAAAFLVDRWDWPLELAIVAGILVTVPVGLVLGLAGIRTRGVNLAIVTLGFALALEAVVFGNVKYTGGVVGFSEADPTLFGVHVSAITHAERYATVALIALVLVGLMITNLRRGRAGRRLIAVRTNERAASALGVSVLGAKLYAFVLGGMIAGLGGILLCFRQPTLRFGEFASIQSILNLQNAVLGGVGTVAGPLAASGIAPGTLGQQIFSFIGDDVAVYLVIAGGVGLLMLLTYAPDGLAFLTKSHNDWWLRRARARFGRRRPPALDEIAVVAHGAVPPKALEVRELTVRFGGVVALSRLTLDAQPGEVVGLIGPNGAGKTTAIEAITGFVTPSEGSVHLGGEQIDGWSREKRARAGLSRSFQSLELFDDLTVLENIQAACDERDVAAYATDLVRPGQGVLTAPARAAIRDFGLDAKVTTKVTDLSYAERRMLAVARAVAGGTSVLLLDEPASGLDEVQTRRLGDAIRKLARERGVAVLLIEHNVDMVMRTCDRVVAVDFGVVIGAGTPDEVRHNQAVLDAYLGTARFRDGHVDHAAAGEPARQR